MKDKIYFPNLNGIRAIAAIMVIIHHIEQFLGIMGKPNYFENPIIMQIGKLGVTLFFVLSGFLISYLLFAEEKKEGTIFIKEFYIRRILRIWPLYYLIIFLSFFILPNIEWFYLPQFWEPIQQHLGLYLSLFLLFLPNLALSKGAILPYGSQSWSVGVEEQFYLIWPVLMKFFKNKLLVILGSIIAYFVVLYIMKKVNYLIPSYVSGFFSSFHIYSMAIGGLFAYIEFYKKELWQKNILNPYIFIIAVIFVLLLMIFQIHHKLIYSILFGIIIYNLACNSTLKKALEFRSINYLGKISYGLYMYHSIAIIFSIRLLDYILPHIQYNTIQYKAGLIILALMITIILSDISYRFIENHFIGLKTKYSKIISGDNASK